MSKKPINKSKPKVIKTSAVYCKKCGTVIFSRAVHDYRSCICKDVSIDGGFDYCKVNYKKEEKILLFSITLPKTLTLNMLYNDWNLGEDKYGLYYKVGAWPKFIQNGLKKAIK